MTVLARRSCSTLTSARGDELDPGDVAGGEVGGFVEAVGNHEDLARRGDRVDGGDEGLGLAVGDGEGIDGLDFFGADEVAEDAAQGELADGLGDLLRVVAGTGAEDDATADEDRGALVAVAGVAGALLACRSSCCCRRLRRGSWCWRSRSGGWRGRRSRDRERLGGLFPDRPARGWRPGRLRR